MPIGAGILNFFGMPQVRPGAMRRNLKGHRSTAYNLVCWEGKEPKEVCSTLSRYLLSGFVHDVRNQYEFMTFFAKVQELEKQRVKVPEAFFAPGQALNFYIQYISRASSRRVDITYLRTYARMYVITFIH